MKIGDKVVFLNETGGGRVSGFQGKNIVLVEDEDGFEVPMQTSEVVVVGEEEPTYVKKVVLQSPTSTTTPRPSQEGTKAEPSVSSPKGDKRGTASEPIERRGGDQLSAWIAFVPIDIKELTHTRFEAFIVNDSNYYLHYACFSAEGNSWSLRYTGEVEPNTKEYLEEFGRESLNEMERLCVQLVAYKRDKPFLLKPAIDVQLRIDPVKFYKLHTFRENNFFEQPALLYTIVENDRVARSLVVDAKKLKEEMYASPTPPAKRDRWEADPDNPAKGEKGKLVVDLHVSALLDTTAGMSPVDILNHQLDVFRKTLREHEKEKGLKIVFIHGKGEGVLRRALINDLQYRFKSYAYQDASFQEYGYGATQVTIK